MSENFYVLNYEAGYDVGPSYLSGQLNHPEYEWELFCPNPHQIEIKNEYLFTVTDEEVAMIDFDFYGEQSYLVSDRFLSLSQKLNVDFRPVPVAIVLPDGRRPDKKYFYLLPAQHISLLDESQSSYRVEVNVETGEPVIDKIFPPTPVYEKITKFVIKAVATPHLFQCIEIMQLVCTGTFKREAESSGLKGLKFTPIDETYIYDPWADW